jgi:hypothetical protein
MESEVIRGEKSWAYFPLAYNILLTVTIGLISLLPDFCLNYFWIIKLLLIIFFSFILFRLFFYNDWFRNKIVGIFSKSKEKV